jgi:hypothetical protein
MLGPAEVVHDRARRTSRHAITCRKWNRDSPSASGLRRYCQGQFSPQRSALRESDLNRTLGEAWLGSEMRTSSGWALQYLARRESPELRSEPSGMPRQDEGASHCSHDDQWSPQRGGDHSTALENPRRERYQAAARKNQRDRGIGSELAYGIGEALHFKSLAGARTSHSHL